MSTITDEQLDITFAALADRTRRAILARLASGEATVNELARPFSISLQAVSKHLKVLERAGLINRGRDPEEPPMTIPMPEDRVHILVAGGVAGWHSLMIPTRAFTVPQTVPIV